MGRQCRLVLPMRVAPAFAEQLHASDLGWLESPAVVYGVDGHLRVAAVNDAWSSFAERNGGGAALAAGELGRSVLDGTRGPIASFYERAFREVLETRRPFEHVLECSSPQVLRICRMVARALDGGGGLLVATSVTIERPHRATSRVARILDPELHLDG